MTDSLCTLTSPELNLAVAALGAEMHYLRTTKGDDLLWHGDGAFWTGRAPVLFPIVGRAVDDMVEAGGLRATMKQHGFARRSIFALDDASETMCRHVLRASDVTRAVYPFEFSLQVTHILAGATLTVEVEIANEGTEPMPFGFGFHPAFRWPLPGTDAPHHVTLAENGSPAQRPLQPDGLLERRLVPGPFHDGRLLITDPLFENGALVFPGGTQDLRYGPDAGPSLAFRFSNLPDLALWRPMGAPFLCIEPWHGTASHVGDGPDIAQRPNSVMLQASSKIRFGYSVTYLD